MTGAELAIVGQGISMIDGASGGGDFFSGNDKNQFAEQLDMTDPSNRAYEAWCKEFAPEKISGAESLWDAPNSVYQFRNGVQLPIGITWESVIGRIDRNYAIRPGTAGTSPTEQAKAAVKAYWLPVAIVGGVVLVIVVVYKFVTRRRTWKW